jgi:hypothetical protein
MMQLTAVATIGGYAAAFRDNGDGTFGEPECPTSEAANTAAVAALALDPDNEDLKLPVAAWKRNSRAFAAMTIAFPKALFRYLISARFMAGAVIRLMRPDYMPEDRISLVECKCRYSAVHLNANTRPIALRELFASIEADFPQAPHNDADRITIILEVAPAMYTEIMAARQLQGGALTSDDLIDAMDVLWRQTTGTARNRQRGQGNDGGRELGMIARAARGRGHQGRGREIGAAAPGANAPVCHNCGRTGHMHRVCRSPFSNFRFRPAMNNIPGGNRPGAGNRPAATTNREGAGHNSRNRVCGECGGRGHETARWFCLPANAA